MRLARCFLLFVLGAGVGCGSESGQGTNGDAPLRAETTYMLGCQIDTLLLQIPIQLSFGLDRPYSADGSALLRSSPLLTFGEQASSDLIDAGVSKIDIISVEIGVSIEGATPARIDGELADAPINDFDLRLDTDDNGAPGPHRLELDPTTAQTTAVDGASEVVLSLELSGVSLVLGDFEVPGDCLTPTLVGVPASFATGAKGNPSEHEEPQQG